MTETFLGKAPQYIINFLTKSSSSGIKVTNNSSTSVDIKDADDNGEFDPIPVAINSSAYVPLLGTDGTTVEFTNNVSAIKLTDKDGTIYSSDLDEIKLYTSKAPYTVIDA